MLSLTAFRPRDQTSGGAACCVPSPLAGEGIVIAEKIGHFDTAVHLTTGKTCCSIRGYE
jgi:hypothetical protein